MKKDLISLDNRFYKKHKIIMLPTEGVSNIIQRPSDGFLYYEKHRKSSAEFHHLEAKHIYLLSDDEIKAGDWIYNSHPYAESKVIQVLENMVGLNYPNIGRLIWKKIIATTDEYLRIQSTIRSDKSHNHGEVLFIINRFSDKFLKSYCKSKGFEEVLVEYERDQPNWHEGVDYTEYITKVETLNTVIIKTD